MNTRSSTSAQATGHWPLATNPQLTTDNRQVATASVAIGLSWGGEVTRITVLDAVGELLEEGMVPNTEAAFRQHFGAMPPSLVSAQFDVRYARLLAQLAYMGHRIVLSGPVPHYLLSALVPAVERFAIHGRRFEASPRSVLLRQSDQGSGIAFSVDLDETGAAVSAWYFIGPVPENTDFASIGAFASQPGVTALEHASRLLTLVIDGELPSSNFEHVVAA